jgi:hypothetical protein
MRRRGRCADSACLGARAVGPLGSDPTAEGGPAAALAIKAVADYCARRLNSCAGVDAEGDGSCACARRH